MKLNISYLKEWIPVCSLALAAFVFGTSEFTPVGLLPDIAKSLGEDEPTTGLLLTVYAWVVAIMSLPLTLATSSMNRRHLMLGLLAVFTIGNFCVALSNTFGTVLASRIIIALTHAIFWSIMAAMAFRLSPDGKTSYGLALISGGSSLSAILGIPLCTYIGHKLGWQMAFFIISATTFIVFLALYYKLPSLPSINTGDLKSLPSLLKNKTLIAAYVITITLVTGHFTIFTYVVPFLIKVPKLDENSIVILLLVYGFSGIFGIFIAGKLMNKNLREIILYGTISAALITVLLKPLGTNHIMVAFLFIAWAVSLDMVFPTFQNWILKLAPNDTDTASSLYSGIFNIGIGSGALFGGIFMRKTGVENLGFSGALFLIPAIMLIYIFAKNNIRVKKG